MRKLILTPYLFVLLTVATPAFSQSFDLGGLPALTTEQNLDGEVTYSLSLQVLALMTAVTLLPSLVLGMTSFTRIIIVLSILRQALGTQQTPPNQVLIAIALFLSLFIMQPTLTEIYNVALSPFLSESMSAEVAISEASAVMKDFMVANTRSDTLLMFSDMAGADGYESNADIPFSTLLPSFITSELKTAFQIGFLLFLALFSHRYGDCVNLNGLGNDDAISNARFPTLQTSPLCFGGRLGSYGRLFGRNIRSDVRQYGI